MISYATLRLCGKIFLIYAFPELRTTCYLPLLRHEPRSRVTERTTQLIGVEDTRTNKMMDTKARE